MPVYLFIYVMDVKQCLESIYRENKSTTHIYNNDIQWYM